MVNISTIISTLVFLSLEIIFIQAKSTQLDEMPHFAKAFNYLLMYPFTAFLPRKGNFPFKLFHIEHTGKCICQFGGIYAYCRYFIDRKW